MTRVALATIGCGVLMLLSASPAAAQSSIALGANVSGNSIVVHATGSADSCIDIHCISQVVQVEVTGDDLCEPLPILPQGSATVPATGGPVDFTTTAPVAAGQTYTVCGYLMQTFYGGITLPAALAGQAQATVSVPAAPLPPCPTGTLTMTAPSMVAYGRSASVTLAADGLTSGTLTMQQLISAAPFYSHVLTSREVLSVAYDELTIPFSVRRGDPAFRIVLSYTSDGRGVRHECVGQSSVTVRPGEGSSPRVSLTDDLGSDDLGGVGVRVAAARGGCARTKPTPLAITVRGWGANLMISAADPCMSRSWRRQGRIPGVSTARGLEDDVNTVAFHLVARMNRSYRATVRLAGRVVSKAVLVTQASDFPAQRVFQGTDKFVNYCIHESHSIYSYRHRLFCWEPALSVRTLRWNPIRT